MSLLDAYLRGQTSDLEPRDAATMDQLAQSLATYQSNRAAGQALGLSDVTGKPSPGILSRVLGGVGRVGGVLNLPAKGVRALLPGPMRGKTGGELFRTEKDDSIPERGAKWLAAFGYDVVTDPLSYVGAPSSLSRKGAAELVTNADEAARILNVAEDALAASGKRADDFIAPLAERSRLKRIALVQEQSGVEAAANTARDIVEKGGEKLQRELAAEELARTIGESLVVGGRSRVTRELTSLFGDEQVARKVFEQLPDAVRGGVFIQNPITGRQLGRIAGGTGAVSRPAEAVNQLRFGLSELGGRAIGRVTGNQGISGRYGTSWQKVREGLRGVVSEGGSIAYSNIDRTTLPVYTALKRATRAQRMLRNQLLFKTRVVLEKAPIARDEFDEAAQSEFDDVFVRRFGTPGAPVDDVTSEAGQRALAEADFLRSSAEELFTQARAAGVDVSDLGDGYSPLQYAPEYWDEQMETGLRGAGQRNMEYMYTASRPRQAWTIDPEVEPNKWRQIVEANGLDPDSDIDDVVSRLGFRNNTGAVVLAPRAINTYLRSIGELAPGKLRFLENPTAIMQNYMTFLANRIAAQKLVNDGIRAGILLVDPVTMARQSASMGDFIAGMRRVAPAVADRAQQALDARRAQLTQMASNTESAAVRRQAELVQETARVRYGDAKGVERLVASQIRDNETVLDKLRSRLSRVAPQLRSYYKSGVEQSVEEGQRLAARAQARFRRAQVSLAEAEAQAKTLRDLKDAAPDVRLTAAENAAQKSRKKKLKAATIDLVARKRDAVEKIQKMWDELTVTDDAAALQTKFDELETYLDSVDEDVRSFLAENGLYDALLNDATQTVLSRTNRVALAETSVAAARAELDAVRAVRVQTLASADAQRAADLADLEAALTRKLALQEEFAQAKAARVAARVDASRFGQRIPRESEEALDVLVTSYSASYARWLEARKARDEARRAGDVDVEPLVAQVDAAREVALADERKIREAIGTWGGKDSPIGRYYDAVMKMARSVSADDMVVARIITDNSKLDALLDEAALVSGSRLEQVAADLTQVFENIRDQISDAEYEQFRDLGLRLRGDSSAPVELIDTAAATTPFGQRLRELNMRIIGSGVEGGNVPVPTSLSNLHAPEGVRMFLENAYRAEQRTDKLRSFISDVYDPLLLLWKTGVTVGRGPGYLATNLAGGMWMNHVAGVTAKTHVETGKALQVFERAKKQAERELPRAGRATIEQRADRIAAEMLAGMTIAGTPAADVLADMIALGGREITQTRERLEQFSRFGSAIDVETLRAPAQQVTAQYVGEATNEVERVFRKVVAFGMNNKVQSRLSDWAQTSELFLRTAAYADGLAKFGSKDAAWDQMVTLHFDYQDLSAFEQTIRRFVPFYTWTRNNVPAQVRALFLQPGKIRKALAAREEFKNAFGTEEEDGWMNEVLPEYIQQVGGFATMFGGDSTLALAGRLPFDDLNRLFTPGVNTRELTQMLGPYQSIIEMFSGISASTGEKFNPQGDKAGGLLSVVARVPGLGSRGREGELRVNAKVAAAISEFLPQLSVAERAVSGVAAAAGAAGAEPVQRTLETFIPERARERGLANLLNLSGAVGITGMSAGTITPSSVTGELRRRQDQQLAQLIDAAGRQGVSLDWVRQQIRDGVPPEVIYQMIQAGAGTIEEVALESQSRKRGGSNDRYLKVLEALRTGSTDTGY